MLPEDLGEPDSLGYALRFGKALEARKGRVFGGFKLERAKSSYQGRARWRVRRIAQLGEVPERCEPADPGL